MNSANPLFSQTRITGSCHRVARFTDSTKIAALDRAVAEEDDCDLVAAEQAARERGAERERDVAADDAGRAKQPVLDVDEMHRATETAAEARVTAHQLRHETPEWCPLCDRVPVRAVIRVDGVVATQLAANTCSHGLLTDAQVDEPVHLVRTRQLPDALLEDADAPHRAEELEADGSVESSGRRDCHARYAATVAPTACCTASTIFASSGRRYASIGSLYGMVASSAVTSCTGAFSEEKPSDATSAAMIAAADA